jgi:hypothetical protein
VKIYIFNAKFAPSEVHLRPFYPLDTVELVDDPSEADYYFWYLRNPAREIQFIESKTFFGLARNRFVFYTNDDNPYYVRHDWGLWFLAQPHPPQEIYDNVVTIPLLMTDHMSIHSDTAFLEQCVATEKRHNFFFKGQLGYAGRKQLQTLIAPGYYFEETTPGGIWGKSDKEKHDSIKSFLLELSGSRFSFAPRGVGSTSFRLFESLMVGTVPIILSGNPRPYGYDWTEFVIDTDDYQSTCQNLLDITNEEYDRKRRLGIEFWNDICTTQAVNENIRNILRERL